jgi:hypothetical protein
MPTAHLVLPPSLHAQAAQWRMTCSAIRASATMLEELEVPEGLHESGAHGGPGPSSLGLDVC